MKKIHENVLLLNKLNEHYKTPMELIWKKKD